MNDEDKVALDVSGDDELARSLARTFESQISGGKQYDEAVLGRRRANATLTIDLESQEIRGPDGGVITFDIDSFRKHCLLNGLDNIGLTLEKHEHIQAFEEKSSVAKPWH